MPGSPFAYIPRKPEETLLYRVISEQLETFLARQHQRDRPVPGFVEDEFRSFLQCGVLEYGFLRLRCETCHKDRLLAFSCKNREFAHLAADAGWPILRSSWWTA